MLMLIFYFALFINLFEALIDSNLKSRHVSDSTSHMLTISDQGCLDSSKKSTRSAPIIRDSRRNRGREQLRDSKCSQSSLLCERRSNRGTLQGEGFQASFIILIGESSDDGVVTFAANCVCNDTTDCPFDTDVRCLVKLSRSCTQGANILKRVHLKTLNVMELTPRSFGTAAIHECGYDAIAYITERPLGQNLLESIKGIASERKERINCYAEKILLGFEKLRGIGLYPAGMHPLIDVIVFTNDELSDCKDIKFLKVRELEDSESLERLSFVLADIESMSRDYFVEPTNNNKKLINELIGQENFHAFRSICGNAIEKRNLKQSNLKWIKCY